MFDEVTKREGGKRAARKGAYLAGSTVFQVAFIAALIFASEKIRAHIQEGPVVDVKFVKQASAPPPPPPPPAPPKRKSAPRPPSDAPRPKPPPPQAMIQPKEVQEEIKLPDPSSKPEPEPDYGDEGGSDDGVVGGVVGASAAPAAAGGGIEEAPQYAMSGWRPPSMKVRNCVQESVRLPRDLQGLVSTVVVKFGVRPNGQPYAFSILGQVPDKRIEQAIWNAITQCEWIPGADASGKPVSIWVTFPLRFETK